MRRVCAALASWMRIARRILCILASACRGYALPLPSGAQCASCGASVYDTAQDSRIMRVMPRSVEHAAHNVHQGRNVCEAAHALYPLKR